MRDGSSAYRRARRTLGAHSLTLDDPRTRLSRLRTESSVRNDGLRPKAYAQNTSEGDVKNQHSNPQSYDIAPVPDICRSPQLFHYCPHHYSHNSSLRDLYSLFRFLSIFEPRSELESTATRNETLAPTSADKTIGVVIFNPLSGVTHDSRLSVLNDA